MVQTVERLHPRGTGGSWSETRGGGESGDMSTQNESPHHRLDIVRFKPEEEEEEVVVVEDRGPGATTCCQVIKRNG